MIVRVLALAAATIAAAPLALADAPVPRPKPSSNATLVSVYDGDTFTAIGAAGGILKIRIAAIDAPEIRARCNREMARADQARTALEELVTDGPLIVYGIARDRWGRLIADVSVAGKVAAGHLLALGLVRRWTGRREMWCGEGNR